MAGILLKIAQWVLGGLIARALVGAGLTAVGYLAFTPILQHGLDMVNSSLGGMAADLLAILQLGGIGEVLSIIGSALLTRVSMLAGLAGLARVADVQGGSAP